MLAAGELFTLIAYAQLILENSRIYAVDDDLLEQIFDFMVKDFSGFALQMVLGHENSSAQEDLFRAMIQKPATDPQGFSRVWQQVLALKDRYRIND
jgi:acyl-CoA dehydrogenase